jgi:hypothetical protein
LLAELQGHLVGGDHIVATDDAFVFHAALPPNTNLLGRCSLK